MKEWTTIDKASWRDAKGEPDKVQYKDEATGLDCLIVRNYGGALCGYVGVSEAHPLHGKNYNDINMDVHGGLTYSDGCQHSDDPAQGICHIPDPGEPDNVWWFGFDCAHAGDICPVYDTHFRHGTYKTIGYVKAEIVSLAAQIAAAGVE